MLNADERPPETVGNFRVIRRLASGGSSDVLLARPIKPAGDHRPVVLKILLPPYRDDPTFERMLAKEAEAYGRLHHPFIVQLFEVFAVRDRLVIVLEYVDGLALNRLRAQLQGGGGWLEDRASAYLAWCIFSALSAAHGARDPETGQLSPVLHRDINPSNVLVPWDGRVKLADFGLAKVTGMAAGDTKTGITKGTFGYMAPEQVRGEKVTERSDVYTATLILWEQFARRKAIQYAALPEIEVMRAMAHPHLVSLDVLRPDLPEKIRRAVAVGLEADPARRELGAEDMVGILRDFVAPDEGRRLLQDTLYRLREGDEEPTIGDRSWARMTPIHAPEAYNGALAEGDHLPAASPPFGSSPESSASASGGVPAFPLEGAVETAPPPKVARVVPTPQQVIPMPALAIAPAPSDTRDPQEEIETQLRPTPSTVSFSELLLPRSADPVGPGPELRGPPRATSNPELRGPSRATFNAEGREPSHVPPSEPPSEHQATLQGGLHAVGVAPAIPPAAGVPIGVAPEPAPVVEPTLVSPAPAGIPTPTSRSVPVQILAGSSSPDVSEVGRGSAPRVSDARASASDPRVSADLRLSADITGPLSDPPEGEERFSPLAKPDLRDSPVPLPELEASDPDLSATMSDRAPTRTGTELAATTPAIPSQMLGPVRPPPTIGPLADEGGIARPPPAMGELPPLHAPILATEGASEPSKSRWVWWAAGAVLLFVGGGLGAASFFSRTGTPTRVAADNTEPTVTSTAPSAAPAPSAAAAPSTAPQAVPTPSSVASAPSSAPSASSSGAAKPAASAKASAEAVAASNPPAAGAAKVEKPEAAKGDTVAPSGDTGTLVVERGGGHRLYVDGKVVGQGSGSHTAPCGKHSVRVGSDGRTQDINIPCGGTVTVQ